MSDRAAQIVTALRGKTAADDGVWHDPKGTFATKPRALLDEAADKIEGLEADLREAVRTAYRRGAMDWANPTVRTAWPQRMMQRMCFESSQRPAGVALLD